MAGQEAIVFLSPVTRSEFPYPGAALNPRGYRA